MKGAINYTIITYYYLLKKFDYFLTKELDDISSYVSVPKFKTKMSKHNLLKQLLNIDSRIEEAYRLTSKYREFNRTSNSANCIIEIEELINDFLSSSLESFNTIGRMLLNWKDEIINSFTIIDSNGNNRISYSKLKRHFNSICSYYATYSQKKKGKT